MRTAVPYTLPGDAPCSYLTGRWPKSLYVICCRYLILSLALRKIQLVDLSQVVVVGFPATALTSGRTRICISAGHSREDLEYAVEKLEEVADKCFLRYSRSAIGS